MSGEGEQISAETGAPAPTQDSSPAPAPAPVEPQTPFPGMTLEEQITTVKEQVVVKKTSPEKPAPAPAPPPPNPVSTSDQETRPRKSKKQPSPKIAEYSSKKPSTTKTSYSKSSRGEYGDYLGVGAALAREFRGTSPSVLENISTHPLLYSPKYEPLKQPHLSARSRKVLRDAADLAVVAPGLKNLLEVQYHFFILFRFCLSFSLLFGGLCLLLFHRTTLHAYLLIFCLFLFLFLASSVIHTHFSFLFPFCDGPKITDFVSVCTH